MNHTLNLFEAYLKEVTKLNLIFIEKVKEMKDIPTASSPLDEISCIKGPDEDMDSGILGEITENSEETLDSLGSMLMEKGKKGLPVSVIKTIQETNYTTSELNQCLGTSLSPEKYYDLFVEEIDMKNLARVLQMKHQRSCPNLEKK